MKDCKIGSACRQKCIDSGGKWCEKLQVELTSYTSRLSDSKASDFNQYYNMYNFGRPTWVTRQRCSGSTCVPCDKRSSSSTDDGCLDGNEHWWSANVAAGSDFRQSEISVNLKCTAGEHVNMEVGYKDNVNGKIKILWNGVEVQNLPHYRDHDQICYDNNGDKLPCDKTGWGSWWQYRHYSWVPSNADKMKDGGHGLYWYNHGSHWAFLASEQLPLGGLKAETEGDNELTVVFERADPTKPASVKIQVGAGSHASFKGLDGGGVSMSFFDCEEHKVCLGMEGLAKHWETQAAKDLRTSTLLQHKCLGGNAPSAIGSVCTEWIGCLIKQGRLDSIKNLLEAFGANAAPTLPQFASGRRLLEASSEATCRNPFLQDPESWDCACHQNMVQKCTDAAEFVSCYQGLLCSNPEVCQSWKAIVGCSGSATTLLDSSTAGGKKSTDLVSLMETLMDAKTSVGWNCG
jgi:hypothetical protein